MAKEIIIFTFEQNTKKSKEFDHSVDQDTIKKLFYVIISVYPVYWCNKIA